MHARVRNGIATLAAIGALLPLAAQSWAQAPAPAPSETAPAAEPNADQGDLQKDEPLTKKFDKNDGVLKPPSGVDPEIHKPTPEGTGDKMPVIIPPGEPGGDQSIKPK
ncbi:hypothetical protein DLM45_15555 [Hyphomicrobium methylovorum]|uniref:hypothetical protein n=1 Tax=Hyphomicrobium methylovorum TaxID=84 RepID=UPI0015E78FFF|nr:hypothetical protein [Hyphomicrobium methylovorum]MBA2127628.1 hypothetical protein [Hyphomicrobium methylovorum]